MASKNTTDCLKGIAHGDSDALDELLRRTQDRLRLLCHWMLLDFPGVKANEQTNDVLQEVNIRLMKSLRAVKISSGVDYFRFASFQIRREMLDLAKDAARRPTPHGDQLPEPSAPDVMLELQKRELRRNFLAETENLPPDEKDVFDLLWIHHLSQAEAAECLAITESVLRHRWLAARRRLAERLQGQFPD